MFTFHWLIGATVIDPYNIGNYVKLLCVQTNENRCQLIASVVYSQFILICMHASSFINEYVYYTSLIVLFWFSK